MFLVCQCLALARTIVEEVKYKSINEILIHFQFPVNFPVVTGGFALLAAVGQTQAVVGGTVTASLFSSSFVGGAAGLLGKEENQK